MQDETVGAHWGKGVSWRLILEHVLWQGEGRRVRGGERRLKIRDFLSFQLHELGLDGEALPQEISICASQPTVGRVQRIACW